MEATELNKPFKFGGDAIDRGMITNLPADACVEALCVADKSGVAPAYISALPEQCAAMNRNDINVQLLAIEAITTRKKDYIYQAAMMDPHTAAELSIDDIVALRDDLIESRGAWPPMFN